MASTNTPAGVSVVSCTYELNSPIKIMLRLVKLVRFSFKWNKAIELSAEMRNSEALVILDEVSELFENDFFEFHILKGRLLAVTDNIAAASENLKVAERLLAEDSKITANDRSYLLGYINYIRRALCGESDALQENNFDLEKVSEHFKRKYPIQ